MDLSDTPQQATFRREARAWLDENLPTEWRGLDALEASADMLDVRLEWEKKLAAGNWIGLSWPQEYGGRGASLAETVVFAEEYARAEAPARLSYFGEGLVGPTLLFFGTDEQKRRFLPAITSASEFWCQGYSEPDAGSDLAAVQTKAVLDGDEWIINGQKVWTTMGHHADYMFILCRTDPDAPKHRGISYLLMPMRQEGVEVRPIKQLTGTAEFSEVFLDQARAPADWVVGGVNNGWRVALATLGFERSTSVLALSIDFEREFDALVEELRKEDRPLSDPVVRDRLMRLYGRLRVLRYSNYRLVTELIGRGGSPGPQSSLTKVYWSEWHRDFGELAEDLLGPYGMLYQDGGHSHPDAWQLAFLQSRAETIYAGTSEIQRNIIGEQVLGLPREPEVSKTSA
ncbi:MAG: acyl-CoA dehydrogenase family protein [Acidimicrobiia bacterium]